MGFSWRESWSGLPFSPPKDLPDPGIEPSLPMSPALQVNSLSVSYQGSPSSRIKYIKLSIGLMVFSLAFMLILLLFRVVCSQELKCCMHFVLVLSRVPLDHDGLGLWFHIFLDQVQWPPFQSTFLKPHQGGVLPTLNFHDDFQYHFHGYFLFSRPYLEVESTFHILCIPPKPRDSLRINIHSKCLQCVSFNWPLTICQSLLIISYSINIYKWFMHHMLWGKNCRVTQCG